MTTFLWRRCNLKEIEDCKVVTRECNQTGLDGRMLNDSSGEEEEESKGGAEDDDGS